MTIDSTNVKDTVSDKLANARKAIGAGVTAGIAAATPLIVNAVQLGSDGGATVTGAEIGIVVGGFFAALASVGYVTWQTANKPKPSDVAETEAVIAKVAAASAPIVVVASPGAVADDSLADADALASHDANLFASEVDETPVDGDYDAKHSL